MNGPDFDIEFPDHLIFQLIHCVYILLCCSIFRTVWRLRLVQTTQHVAYLTCDPTKRSLCTLMIISSAEFLQSPSRAAADCCLEDTMTSIVISGTLWNKTGPVTHHSVCIFRLHECQEEDFAQSIDACGAHLIGGAKVFSARGHRLCWGLSHPPLLSFPTIRSRGLRSRPS